MTIQLGGGARDGGCVATVSIEYSTPDRLAGKEVYKGPTGKPGFRDMRRVWWHSGLLLLGSKAPTSGAQVNHLWMEIAEMGARRMFEDPTASMLEALMP